MAIENRLSLDEFLRYFILFTLYTCGRQRACKSHKDSSNVIIPANFLTLNVYYYIIYSYLKNLYKFVILSLKYLYSNLLTWFQFLTIMDAII